MIGEAGRGLGAFQIRSIRALPPGPRTDVGALGIKDGAVVVVVRGTVVVVVAGADVQTPLLGADQGDTPCAFTAATLKLYCLPFVSPTTEAEVVVDNPSANSIHVLPSSAE